MQLPEIFAPISKHAMITDMRVVGYMHAFMQEIAITNNRLSFRIGRAVNHHVFTNHIVISDLNNRIASFVIKSCGSAAMTAQLKMRFLFPIRVPLMILA